MNHFFALLHFMKQEKLDEKATKRKKIRTKTTWSNSKLEAKFYIFPSILGKPNKSSTRKGK